MQIKGGEFDVGGADSEKVALFVVDNDKESNKM